MTSINRVQASLQLLLLDLSGATLVGIASAVWLKLWTTLATSGKVDSKDSRKLIHCGSGPLFMLCWPFFSADPSARFFAAAVPLLQAIAVIASGLAKEQPDAPTLTNATTIKMKPSGLVAAISRSGNPAEVLRGPLIYVIVLLLSTLSFWRESMVGLVAISQMAAGDGMADIVGRRWGEKKWAFSSTKSYAGTGAFVVSGFLVSVGLIAWFHLWGLVPALTLGVVGRVGVISVLCAMVELVPWGDDNVSVPVVASVLATALLM
ncbi:phosphatidate cytidylyltransferase [Nannochloropsis oceanica]